MAFIIGGLTAILVLLAKELVVSLGLSVVAKNCKPATNGGYARRQRYLEAKRAKMQSSTKTQNNS
ncbi:hypothetical protein OFO03_04075 [Campylobacter sp. JMF_02 ED1]|uniref:hypothetical protein n=1 Tax=unclassified Campylobacter TaxID=2593542 RepID=UPI0022EA030D|nr:MULTISPECIES: hypothetical protein [unclassified Campylobacter]MDA3049500.1 hypothetical protein [Campylobacter sp. JMF_15 NE4]MDA3051073.1 hypothetical protein [Campylobacter sp. JMF_02 ED1]